MNCVPRENLVLRKPRGDGTARKVKPKAPMEPLNQVLLEQAAHGAVYFASPYLTIVRIPVAALLAETDQRRYAHEIGAGRKQKMH
jgi:hypothetical protein